MNTHLTHTAAALKRIAHDTFGSGAKLAEAAALTRDQFSRDSTGRTVFLSDDRFHAYLGACNAEDKKLLIQARLDDLLPDPVDRQQLPLGVQKQPHGYKAPLRLKEHTRKQLEKLIESMISDPDLEEWFNATVALVLPN